MDNLPLLRSAVFGGCKELFLSLPEEDRKNALLFIKKYGYEALFFPSLAEVLSEEEKSAFQAKIRQLTIRAMIHEQGLKKLDALLNEHKIRYCRIKGGDLAYRIYPHPAMRPFGDWDILFHPDDLQKVETLLVQDGWTPIYENTNVECGHHLSPLRKDYFLLEPHYSLANFNSVDPLELWQEIRPVAPGSSHHILSPEMNLLMLMRHAASNHYLHMPLCKLLLDAAYLLKKEKIDWQKVHALAEQWELPYPDDILGAWPEFFPPDFLSTMSPNPERCQMIRTIFKSQPQMSAANSWELVVQDRILSWQWIKDRLKTLRPELLRHRAHDQKTSIVRLLFRDLYKKSLFFLTHIFHRNHTMDSFFKALYKFENSNRK